MSPRRPWDSPNPSPASECALPLPRVGSMGGEAVRHTRLRLKGWGSPNSDDRRKSLALSLLCADDISGRLGTIEIKGLKAKRKEEANAFIVISKPLL